ncbi:MAG TPA: PQQ-dependent sugar dehydrogenase [Anaerolineales bacterium]|nr:PQQ-dependent sugar dehydrogenase [Anaerolineales bacterium]
MKRFLILLILPVLACNGLSTPSPSPTEPASPTSTGIALTQPPPTTPTSPTEPPPATTTFPNSNAYEWRFVVDGLERPIDLQPDPLGRLWIVEKLGHIHLLQNGELTNEPIINIEDRVNDESNEMGLLGLALHPNFAQNGFFYVNYTGARGDTFISRFTAGENSVDSNSEAILLRVKQPYPNHNGGTMNFGPDGYLYIGLGDGGSGGDPEGNGQSLDTLLGKILRIDVDSAQPYAIPADNPFGDEIWAYGLRNPWRMSFDAVTGDLYIGDVGQGEWEEIDIIPAGSRGGENFGWNYREGAHDFEGGGPAGMIDPIAEYSHNEGGCSVTGGYVYRGSMPEWNGIYLYGDYCTGQVWGLIRSGEAWQNQLLFDTDVTITSFGQDKNGEVYILTDGGDVYILASK